MEDCSSVYLHVWKYKCVSQSHSKQTFGEHNHTILRVVDSATESTRHSGPQLQLLIRYVRIWKTMPEKQHKKENKLKSGSVEHQGSEFPDVYLDFCDSLQQNTRQCLKCSPSTPSRGAYYVLFGNVFIYPGYCLW